MKFSIVTPSYGQGRYIRQNIESVLRQDWGDYEHIVVDGGSKDETVEILRSFPHLKWVSEKDEGQADALNKGLRMATGDIVGWINSDDYYFDGVFNAVAKCFEDPAVKWVIGNISLLDEASSELIPISSPKVSLKSLTRNPDIVRQQGTFFRRDFLLGAGGWNKAFFMVMDFDLWIRLARQSEPLMHRQQLAVFRIQKEQKTGLANLRRQCSELGQVLTRERVFVLNVWRLRLKKDWHWLKGTLKLLLVNMGLLNKKFLHRPYRGWKGG
jgi:glycosyltransferase involved in cell wall biosynthesis